MAGPPTNYYTVDGQIIGESTGGVRTDYLTDALGSVTATVDANADVVNTYRYKPYGSLLAKTGGGADPKFQWVGTYGYRKTGRTASELYVRARHYGYPQGAWTTIDELWPGESQYGYVRNNPVSRSDPTGLLENACGEPSDEYGCNADVRDVCSYSNSQQREEIQRSILLWLNGEYDCFIDEDNEASKKYPKQIIDATYCLVPDESAFNPCCKSKGWTERARGLWQLGFNEWTRCAPVDCRDKSHICGLWGPGGHYNWKVGCQTRTAANMIKDYCQHLPEVTNVLIGIQLYWAVAQTDDGNYPKFVKCIESRGTTIEDLQKIKCPTCDCEECPGRTI